MRRHLRVSFLRHGNGDSVVSPLDVNLNGDVQHLVAGVREGEAPCCGLAMVVSPNPCPYPSLGLRVHGEIAALWDRVHECEGEERGQGVVLITTWRMDAHGVSIVS